MLLSSSVPRARSLRDDYAYCFISQMPVQADKVNVVDCVLEAGKKHAMLYKVQLSDDPKDIVYRTYDDFFDFNLMLHGMVSWRCSRYPSRAKNVSASYSIGDCLDISGKLIILNQENPINQ
jgi:hypothetical protein